MPQIQPTSLKSPDAQAPRVTRGKLCPRCQTVYTEDAEEGNFCGRDGVALLESDQIFAGKYVLGKKLGFGQMGDVYAATQAGVGRQVALKILRADHLDNPDMVKRFEREAQIASSIDHPNAVTIFESGRGADGQAYIAMELLDGETLERCLQREGPLGTARALELLMPVVRAVAAAHGRGVVHRDLKPDNIFIAHKQSEGGGEQVVKVLDFGIAGRINSAFRMTVPNMPLGTPLYMAPEQLQGGDATLRSDVFALGVILTEMLTGRLPWGETVATTSPTATMARVVRPPWTLAELLPGGQFPETLEALVKQLLARDPALRPADASAVFRALQPIVIASTPGMHLEMLSARLLAVGSATMTPFIDSTSTLTGRETQPLTTIPGRVRWLLAASVLAAMGLFALVWQWQHTPSTGPIENRGLTAAATARAALPVLLLPPGTSASLDEPPPAGFTAPPPTTSLPLAEPPPVAAPPESTAHHRHRHRESAGAGSADSRSHRSASEVHPPRAVVFRINKRRY